jgi:hypothetical protein
MLCRLQTDHYNTTPLVGCCPTAFGTWFHRAQYTDTSRPHNWYGARQRLRGKPGFFLANEGVQLVHLNDMQWFFRRHRCIGQLIAVGFDPVHDSKGICSCYPLYFISLLFTTPAEVLRLADKLSYLAGTWRKLKQETIVHEYGKTLLTMILKGYNLDRLPIEDQLPEELMPYSPPLAVRQAIRAALAEAEARSYGRHLFNTE